jgi:putative ABC transport system ATP-binding protein
VVVRGVSLQLQRGEMVLVMGPSGSGKSTLLALLSGLMRPEEGDVLALGENLWKLSASARKQFRRRHFGFIFQGYNLFPALTALQHLEMILRWGAALSAQIARKRGEQILDMLGLRDKKGLRPAQLSGGEKQRVAIGRAVVKEPAFIFADEPTSALDWEHGQKVVELLRSAASARRACVFVVSHDARIVPYADRVIHLEDGSVKEEEETENLTPVAARSLDRASEDTEGLPESPVGTRSADRATEEIEDLLEPVGARSADRATEEIEDLRESYSPSVEPEPWSENRCAAGEGAENLVGSSVP